MYLFCTYLFVKTWFTNPSRNCCEHQSSMAWMLSVIELTDVLCIVWITQLNFRGWSGVLVWGGRGGVVMWSSVFGIFRGINQSTVPRAQLSGVRHRGPPISLRALCLPTPRCCSVLPDFSYPFLHVKQCSTVPLPPSQEERAGYHELSGCYVPGLWSLRTVRAQSFSVHQHFTGKQVSAPCICTMHFVHFNLTFYCLFVCCVCEVGQTGASCHTQVLAI